MIEELIKKVVEDPSEENKQEYLSFVNQTEYSLLQDAETFLFKSQEYFDKRKQAFAYRRECAIMFLNSWIATHKTTENSPVTYADTLIIPFTQIKRPCE
jgi:hypothetical protein